MEITLGVNSNSELFEGNNGRNRIRFESISARLRKISADIVHKIPPTSTISTPVNSDARFNDVGGDCVLRSELEIMKQLETSKHFDYFYRRVSTLVQSLPELLHNLDKLVQIFTEYISPKTDRDKNDNHYPDPQDLGTYFRLLNVLISDAGAQELERHSQHLLQLLLSIDTVNAVAYFSSGTKGKCNPELAAKMFECASHLMRSQQTFFSKSQILLPFYGSLLGHSLPFIRDFSAKMFMIITRKLSSHDFLLHVNKILSAISTHAEDVNCFSSSEQTTKTFSDMVAQSHLSSLLLQENSLRQNVNSVDHSHSDSSMLPIAPDSNEAIDVGERHTKQRKLNDLFSGVALLLFYTMKGSKCCLHSKGASRLSILIGNILSRPSIKDLKDDDVLRGRSAESTLKMVLAEIRNHDKDSGRLSSSSVHSTMDYADLSSATKELIECQVGTKNCDSNTTGSVRSYCSALLAGDVYVRLFRHLHPTNSLPLWEVLCTSMKSLNQLLRCVVVLNASLPFRMTNTLSIAVSSTVEMVIFALQHSNGRGLSSEDVKNAIATSLIENPLDLCLNIFVPLLSDNRDHVVFSNTLRARVRTMVCLFWTEFHSYPELKSKIPTILQSAIANERTLSVDRSKSKGSLQSTECISDVIRQFCEYLLQHNKSRSSNMLPQKILRECFFPTVLRAILSASSQDLRSAIEALFIFMMHVKDCRRKVSCYFHSFAEGNESTVRSRPTAKAVTRDAIVHSVGDSERFYDSEDSDKDSNESDEVDEEKILRKSWNRSFGAASKIVPEEDTSSPLDIEYLFQDSRSALAQLLEICTDRSLKILQSCTEGVQCDEEDFTSAVMAVKCLIWASSLFPSILVTSSFTSFVQSIENTLFSRDRSLMEVSSKFSANMRSLSESFSSHLLVLWSLQSLTTVTFSIGGQSVEDSLSLLAHTMLRWVQDFLQQKRSLTLNITWAMNVTLHRLRIMGIDISSLASPAFEAIVSRLAEIVMTPSRWLRINILHLLKYFSPSVSNSNKVAKKSSIGSTTQLSERNGHEASDVWDVCLRAASVPIGIASIRLYAQHMETLEVLVRNERMPPQQMMIVGGMCLGLLQVQFKPFWQPAITVIIAAATANTACEEMLWPFIRERLTAMLDIPSGIINTVPAHANVENERNYLLELTTAFIDSGIGRLRKELSHSRVFFFSPAAADRDLDGEIEDGAEDLRTDTSTSILNILALLKLMPVIILRRSKDVVLVLTRFLGEQYYKEFSTEAEKSYLENIGLIDKVESSGSQKVDISRKALKQRLSAFLGVMSAVASPKQLHRSEVLFKLYLELLSKPDLAISKLAFDCVAKYKIPALGPHRECIGRLFEEKTMREELVKMQTFIVNTQDNSEDKVRKEHRSDLIPVLIAIIFGRIVSKSGCTKAGKDHFDARRNAALAFFSCLSSEEIKPFVCLMIRGILPPTLLFSSATSISNTDSRSGSKLLICTWQESILSDLSRLSDATMLSSVAPERLIGYLHLLGQSLKILGLMLSPYSTYLYKTALIILEYSTSLRESILSERQHARLVTNANNDLIDDNSDVDSIPEEEQEVGFDKHFSASAQIRSLCMLRIKDMVETFNDKLDFIADGDKLFQSLSSLLEVLPAAIANSNNSKPPVLLRILHSMTQYTGSINLVAKREKVVRILISCIATSKMSVESVRCVVESLSSLLDYENGQHLLVHSELLVGSFCQRFAGTKLDLDNLKDMKISEMVVNPEGSLKLELDLLCRIATKIAVSTDIMNMQSDSHPLENLSTILLALLRSYIHQRRQKVEETWVINILHVYRTISIKLLDVAKHVPFISRLFGPSPKIGSASLFDSSSVRHELIELYTSLASHPSTHGTLAVSAKLLLQVVREDPTLVGCRDFASFIPVFQGLSGDIPSSVDNDSGSIYCWSGILGPDAVHRKIESEGFSDAGVISISNVLVHESLRCMYDADLVVRTSALAALKKLLSDLKHWLVMCELESSRFSGWSDLVKSIIVPAIRKGLKSNCGDDTKKSFLLLLAHCITEFKMISKDDSNWTQLQCCCHTDLYFLCHEEAEQNFFENITHIQIHRRFRALNKLKRLLQCSAVVNSHSPEKNDELDGEGVVQASEKDAALCIAIPSFVHVLLPIVYHYVFMAINQTQTGKESDYSALRFESAGLLGAIVFHLPWNHYYNATKAVLRRLDKMYASQKATDKEEKIQLTALCKVLDAFHFGIDVDSLDNQNSSSIDEVNAEAEEDEGVVAVDKDKKPVPSISNIVVKTILPWVKRFSIKEVKDHKGNKSFVVQPLVAVALTTLICNLRNQNSMDTTAIHDGSLWSYSPVIHSIQLNLVISVIQTLKSRDSSARDGARDSLGKMIMAASSIHSNQAQLNKSESVIDPKRALEFLKMILNEMQHILREGYQRHVCNYTVRTLLRTVLDSLSYQPPPEAVAPCTPLSFMMDDSSQSELDKKLIAMISSYEVPPFDNCISVLVEFSLDELVGEAFADRSAAAIDDSADDAGGGAIRSLIREAKGSKANDILEAAAKHILFRPTYALFNGGVSSVHLLVSPLLDALAVSTNDGSSSVSLHKRRGRVIEALQRVASSLAKNPSLKSTEVLLYLHSTLSPFVATLSKNWERSRTVAGRNSKDNGSMEVDNDLPSYFLNDEDVDEIPALGSEPTGRAAYDDVTGHSARTWLPTDRRALLQQRQVVLERNRLQRERGAVQDGASAPKLTGKGRKNSASVERAAASATSYDPVAIEAVRFCLTLLFYCLRDKKISNDDPKVLQMVVPFLPLLGQCLRLQSCSSDLVALAMKCIGTMLGFGVPVEISHCRNLASTMLGLMVKGGALLSTDNDLVHACLRGLAAVFRTYNDRGKAREQGHEGVPGGDNGSTKISSAADSPLSEDQLRSLVQLLTVSILDPTSTTISSTASFSTAAVLQNSCLLLVKEIVRTRFMLPELYDLVAKLGDQIVLSSRKATREASINIFITFLITYPMGDKRLNSQVKQLLNNCANYEFEEGRLSALEALNSLVKLLPLPVMEKHAFGQLFFLSMTLQLLNDAALKCRLKSAEVLSTLFRKLPKEIITEQFLQFALKWMDSSSLNTHSEEDKSPLGGASALIIAGAKVCSILVQSRQDLVRRKKIVDALFCKTRCRMQEVLNFSGMLSTVQSDPVDTDNQEEGFEEGIGASALSFLNLKGSKVSGEDWVVLYQLTSMVEQCLSVLPGPAGLSFVQPDSDSSIYPLMPLILESLLYPHAWVRAASCRVIVLYLQQRDVFPGQLALPSAPEGSFEFLIQKNGMYQLGRRMCVFLSHHNLTDGMLDHAATAAVFTVRAMFRNPHLMSSSVGASSNGADDGVEDSVDIHEDTGEHVESDGATWMMRRLRGVGFDNRGDRVLHIMRVYLLLMSTEDDAIFWQRYMNQVVEIATKATLAAAVDSSAKQQPFHYNQQRKRRHDTEGEGESEGAGEQTAPLRNYKEVANLLLAKAEEKIGAAQFLGILSSVQRNLQRRKAGRKRERAAEAIVSPQEFAIKKMERTAAKGEQRKRKNSNFAAARSGFKRRKL